MMRKLLLIFAALSMCVSAFAQTKSDIIIVGGTPGGIMTAISAARMGKSSIILERTSHIGGLPANGLGATDIATKAATTGLFREFVNRIKQHYADTYGADSAQVKVSSNGYHFEPSAAEKVLTEMLAEHKDKITVLTMRQFDAENENIKMRDDKIESILVLNRTNGKKEEYVGRIFIDATYEGDLGAAAGVPFRVGREGRNEFNEPGAGRVYKYWFGKEGAGSTFEADNAIQAYNYRLCLTNDPAKRIEIGKPKNYNREEYASFAEDVWTGTHTKYQMEFVTEKMKEENRKHIASGKITKIPGDPWGMRKVSYFVHLPNKKIDANNQGLSFVSTDLPEENWPWPTSSWEWRDRFAQRLRDYTIGFLWFCQNDSALPEHFRKNVKEWGFPKDEYQDNQNFPRQVYVREGRRLEGQYFFTAKDALPVALGERPPLHASSITSSHYPLDSHAVRKRETGRIGLDGFISYPSSVYTVPYGVMVPKTVDNLLFPVPVSASHIGFSTLRMEPCWMALGEAAGVASSIAIDENVKVKNVPVDALQKRLIDQKATLILYRDIKLDSPHFKMVQTLGLKGYLPEWEARLKDAVDNKTIAQWKKLSKLELADVKADETSRLDALQKIYKTLSDDN